jgi:NADPH:quinone reductase-like Zn-dependent oxidoreductase
VLIKVIAAGINPVDWKIRAGYLKPAPLPFTLGLDLSGTIEVAGTNASFATGDEVYGQASLFNGGAGSFAEFALASTGIIAAKPRTLDHLHAAAFPLVAVSALQAISEFLHLSAGQKILIHGGAGGIGSVAIQLAKHLGAYVATTVSSADIDYVKSLGAHEAIDYKKQRFDDVLTGFDAVFDTVGGDSYTRSFKIMKRGGRIVSMLEDPNKELMEKFGVEASHEYTDLTSARLTAVANLADQGVLKINVDKTFPLSEGPAALEQLEKKSPRGKIVLKMT